MENKSFRPSEPADPTELAEYDFQRGGPGGFRFDIFYGLTERTPPYRARFEQLIKTSPKEDNHPNLFPHA